MANLTETDVWADGIYRLEDTDPVLGGEDGVSNKAFKQLANRTQYLKKQLEAMGLSSTQVNQLLEAVYTGVGLDKQGQDFNASWLMDSLNLLMKSTVQVLDVSEIPAVKSSNVIVLMKPHYRYFVWNGTQYVRAPWHSPAMMQYSYDNPPSIAGYLRVDGLSQYDAVNYPDLAARLGVAADSNFSLIDVRGEFIRVLDNGRGIDVDRLPLSYQYGTAATVDNPPAAYITSIWNSKAVTSHDAARQVMGMDKPDGFNMTDVFSAIGGSASGSASFATSEVNSPNNHPSAGMSRPRNIPFPLWLSI